MADEKIKITSCNLILCEGKDEVLFLNQYLFWLKEQGVFEKSDPNVQIINFGGVKEFKRKLRVIVKAPGFQDVRSILIIQDAETDADASRRSICDNLKNNGLPAPSRAAEWERNDAMKLAYLLFPKLDGYPTNGTLEDLCVTIIDKSYNPDAVIELIENDMSNLESRELRAFPHKHKSKLHGFFSLTDRFVGDKVGEAAAAGAFDWNNEKLSVLKRMIIENME